MQTLPDKIATPTSHSNTHTHIKTKTVGSIAALFVLTVGALGVVYGDIGTSPLYAVNEIFFGRALSQITRADIVGGISLVVWALTLVVAFKYVFFVLRADNEGEGGVFALYSKIQALPKPPWILLGLLLIGAGLLYGDGIITPAISVMSAVEGLTLVTRAFQPFVIVTTITILTALFAIQSKGTANIGKLFGPIMIVWFGTIGAFGLAALATTPSILQALSPLAAASFITHHSIFTILLTLGSVMLVITGGEAMYADMGHFGRTPIRLGWYLVAYPALLLNYLGQGAYLLSGRPILQHNVFFSMIPHPLLVPMVVLATLATIIASQALISGAFSLTMQAISLRLLPYMPVRHTHAAHEGQVYLPHINAGLYIGAVALVVAFGTSTRLAGAYGLAVSGVMLVTTLGLITIATRLWHWNQTLIYSIFVPFALLDGLFLAANSLKLIEGGFIPLAIGLSIFGIIKIWQWGRGHTIKAFESYKTMTVQEAIQHQQTNDHDLARTMVFLTRLPINNLSDRVPIQLQRFWDRIGVLPKHLVFLTVEFLKTPHAKQRFVVSQLNLDETKQRSVTSIIVRFGFMEDPNLEPLLSRFIRHKDIPSTDPPEHWSFKIVYERILPPLHMGIRERIQFSIYSFLHHNTDSVDHYFGLGQSHPLTIDIFPVRMQ